MVGQVGTEAMSGVAIGNQLHFVYYNCLMGIVAGGNVFGVLLFAAAPFIPQVYATTSTVRELASQFMRILAVCLPISCFTHVAFFYHTGRGKSSYLFFVRQLKSVGYQHPSGLLPDTVHRYAYHAHLFPVIL